MKIKADYVNEPQWRQLVVKSSLPEELKCLDELAHNLWWVWNFEARDLFRDLDPKLYSEVKHNPVLLLERLSYERKEEIVKDKALMKRIKALYEQLRDYGHPRPKTPAYPQLSSSFQQSLENIAISGMDAEEQLNKSEERISAKLERYTRS